MDELQCTLEELQNAYIQAVAEGKRVFLLNDVPILTDYAKYLIEYMLMQSK